MTEFPIIPWEEVEAKKTRAGSWTRKTLKVWGVNWPPRAGWRKRLALGLDPNKPTDDEGVVIRLALRPSSLDELVSLGLLAPADRADPEQVAAAVSSILLDAGVFRPQE